MRVNLRHWTFGEAHNFGDALSPYIVRKLLGSQHTLTVNGGEGDADLLAIGSWLHYAKEGTHIWGTGLRTDPPAENDAKHDYKSLKVHAVRGPLTRDFLLRRGIWCPPIYGDPALILPELFQPGRDKRLAGKVALLPHCGSVQKYADLGEFHVINPVIHHVKDVEDVIRQLVSCAAVVSQSLHGLIVSDAYGIPNVWLQDLPSEGDFKFRDYFASVGRTVAGISRLADFEVAQLWLGSKPDTTALIRAFPFR